MSALCPRWRDSNGAVRRPNLHTDAGALSTLEQTDGALRLGVTMTDKPRLRQCGRGELPVKQCRCMTGGGRNRPGLDVPQVVVRIPDPVFAQCGRNNQACGLDACIADVIQALWRNNLVTYGCCCGHGGMFGETRPSVIVDAYDAEVAHGLLRCLDNRPWKVLAWRIGEFTRDGRFIPEHQPGGTTEHHRTRPA